MFKNRELIDRNDLVERIKTSPIFFGDEDKKEAVIELILTRNYVDLGLFNKHLLSKECFDIIDRELTKPIKDKECWNV